MVHLPSATIRRELCICNIEVVNEFFNSEVVTTVDRSNIEVVNEFFNYEVVEEVFVSAAIRLLRGCRAPPPSSRLQGSRSVFCTCLNETIPLSSCS